MPALVRVNLFVEHQRTRCTACIFGSGMPSHKGTLFFSFLSSPFFPQSFSSPLCSIFPPFNLSQLPCGKRVFSRPLTAHLSDGWHRRTNLTTLFQKVLRPFFLIEPGHPPDTQRRPIPISVILFIILHRDILWSAPFSFHNIYVESLSSRRQSEVSHREGHGNKPKHNASIVYSNKCLFKSF